MKVKIFKGITRLVQQEFNRWAKGKALTKDVIIHTTPFQAYRDEIPDHIAITVYYPEGSQFDQERTNDLYSEKYKTSR